MNEIEAELIEDHEGKQRIVPALWPSPDFCDFGVRGDRPNSRALALSSRKFSGQIAEARFVDVVADVMDRRMQQNDRIVVMGEDVHRLKGGTNGATRD